MGVDAREHVTQVGPWIDAVELGRLHQAHDHRRALAGQLAAHEQPARSGTLKLRVPPYRYKSRASCAKYPIACVKKGGTQGKWPATGAALQSVSETLPANAPRASMAFSAAVEVL